MACVTDVLLLGSDYWPYIQFELVNVMCVVYAYYAPVLYDHYYRALREHFINIAYYGHLCDQWHGLQCA